MNASERTPSELDGRTAAALAVTDAVCGQRFVNESLRALRDAGRLAGREAGLAMEIAQGTLRHLITIEHVLGAVARFKPELTVPRLRAVLYTAAYQIIWMDRIPPFAAVDQAVELARQLVRGRSPSMANAVLRRLTGALAERGVPWRRLDPAQVRVSWDQACSFNKRVLPKPGDGDALAAHLAAATGERLRRYAELLARYGVQQAESVAWASQALPAAVLHRNAIRATPEVFCEQLHGVSAGAALFAGEAAYLPPSVAFVDTAVFRDGLAYVQDTTAHEAAEAVAARPGERVLDLCAAPGGKSVALALAMEDKGVVLACDTASGRLDRVEANVVRLGLTCVRTRTVVAGESPLPAGTPLCDAALVDVPCSNTGVIARRPEARLGLSARKLRSLTRAQQELLRQAAQCVRPGGRLVYSTCSIEPEENERVATAFLSACPEWRLDLEKTTLPAWGPRWSDWRDGGYFARLIRASDRR